MAAGGPDDHPRGPARRQASRAKWWAWAKGENVEEGVPLLRAKLTELNDA